MIRRISFLFLGIWLSASPAAADRPPPNSPTSDVSLLSPDRLRRVSEAEFRRSLVGGVVRGVDPEVHLSHGFSETFLPAGSIPGQVGTT